VRRGLLLVAVFAVALGACSSPGPTPLPAPSGSEFGHVVRVGAGTFYVEVADDTAERAQGLSGRDSLPANAGMWFAYLDSAQRSFWMRGMRFPIDIVWVDESFVVVDVTHEAPVPPVGAATSDLPQYSAGEPVQYVLEISAGFAVDLGIERGSKVTLTARREGG
jgi:uncharacterized membrane protein (UPF0127 family)